MKKLYTIIVTLLLLFIYYLFVLYNPKDYKVNYKIEEYLITEKYVKDTELYEFYINYNNQVYPLTLQLKYNKNRKNIKNIKIKNDDSNCIYVTIRDNDYPVCYQNNILIHHSLIKQENSAEAIDEFKTTTCYDYDELNYYVWNYKGFDFISKDGNKSIELLKNDNYENSLAYLFKNYLIFPNYDEKYFFEKLYIINMQNNKVSDFNLNEEISYFSNFMGYYKNDLYLLDKKNQKQYKINFKNQKIKTVGSLNKNGVIINLNKLEKYPIKTIINKNLTFNYSIKYNYKLIDKNLYLQIGDYKMLVSKKDIKEIIQIIDDKILYLSDDILYSFSTLDGEKKILQNKEWDFNYLNKIFVFNNK